MIRIWNKTGLLFLMFFCLGSFQVLFGQETVKDPLSIEELDKPPVPPGGIDGWNRFLMNNLKYPVAARNKRIEGDVILKFIIEKDGSISNQEILNKVGGGCDMEALRVLSLSPKWTPGLKDGQPVRTIMHIPIRFRLGN
ncbi:energy transducer TonB [Algoriphagus formosus]|uniref:Energy transducer TonB n=1 Tax=Algoriphagus formosus TaxID=2007308 RepID=A0A4R5UU02_9BACT|nr:energy transducer TonB [Algoriphagus aquimaris]TDK42633.1 energy transducer TonB [Algoriphagus aquimaris]